MHILQKECETKDFVAHRDFFGHSAILCPKLKHRALGTATLKEKVMKKERQGNAKADKMEEVDHEYVCERQGGRMGRWV